ncbi:MAG: ATP-binding protein [Candidatus Eisenbacteria bacterium]|uniref:ATP-binding protein n=1 Tax=Eiseniibacteriota bacterium TaxID=2212470 RepID=A0A956M4D3_UNCEI|nr:ATP-binding protein [Candidatus Eisenbacteria bacterium]
MEGQGIKVAFIGSHGVGKTTLCYEIAARLKRRDLRVDLVKEVARRCPLPINKESTIDAQAWILHTQMAMEIETRRDHDVVICDRSVLDNYAYLVAACGRQPVYDALVRAWLPTYDLMVWVPITETPRFDGIRDTDRTFQERIDTLIGQLVTDLGADLPAPPLRLHGLDRESWVGHIMRAMPFDNVQLPLFGEEDLS